MKKILLLCCLLLGLPTAALAANEKIDPATYICAELVALPTTDGQPPLFEALQIDGFASAAQGGTAAHPEIMAPLLSQVYEACQSQPTEKMLTLWEKAREALHVAEDGPWKADKTTCRDYAANEEDGSGFLVWLDGYNRQKSGTSASVLESNDTVNAYLEACNQKPEALMLDVMRESAR